MRVAKRRAGILLSATVVTVIAVALFYTSYPANSLTLLADSTQVATENASAIRLTEGLMLKVSNTEVPIVDFAFRPDGQQIATVSGSPDNTVQVWNVPSGKLSFAYPKSRDWVPTIVQFTPDGKLLIATGINLAPLSSLSQSFVFDVDTGQMIIQGDTANGTPTSTAISPDGSKFLVAVEIVNRQDNTTTGAIYQWDVKTPSNHDVILTASQGGVDHIALSPDGKLLTYIVVQSKPPMGLNDMLTPSNMATLSHAPINSYLNLWDMQLKQSQLIASYKSPVLAFVQSLDGNLGATATEDETVKLWDIQNRLPGLTLTHAYILPLAFSPNGKILATGDISNANIRLWDTATGTLLATQKSQPTDIPVPIRSLGFSPDGQFLAVGGEDSIVRFWHVQQ